MKIFIEIDTEKNQEDEVHNFITQLYKKGQKNPSQQQLESQKNNDVVSIVLRDGENKTTESVKNDLKRLGFNYYKYKKNSQIEDPRWTQTCKRTYWNEIKEHTAIQDLNIWTSDKNGGDE